MLQKRVPEVEIKSDRARIDSWAGRAGSAHTSARSTRVIGRGLRRRRVCAGTAVAELVARLASESGSSAATLPTALNQVEGSRLGETLTSARDQGKPLHDNRSCF